MMSISQRLGLSVAFVGSVIASALPNYSHAGPRRCEEICTPHSPCDQPCRDGVRVSTCGDFDYDADCRDSDRDRDGLMDREDNCPDTANPGQLDCDGDGRGDVCDPLNGSRRWIDGVCLPLEPIRREMCHPRLPLRIITTTERSHIGREYETTYCDGSVESHWEWSIEEDSRVETEPDPSCGDCGHYEEEYCRPACDWGEPCAGEP